MAVNGAEKRVEVWGDVDNLGCNGMDKDMHSSSSSSRLPVAQGSWTKCACWAANHRRISLGKLVSSKPLIPIHSIPDDRQTFTANSFIHPFQRTTNETRGIYHEFICTVPTFSWRSYLSSYYLSSAHFLSAQFRICLMSVPSRWVSRIYPPSQSNSMLLLHQ